MTEAETLSLLYPGYVESVCGDLHAHPEQSADTERTVAKIASELRSFGIPYEIVGERNAVGLIEGFGSGPSVALCADTDAQPVLCSADSASGNPARGNWHTGGHDAQTAALLAAARALRTRKMKLKGKIYLCFCSGGVDGKHAAELGAFLRGKGGQDFSAGVRFSGGMAEGTAAAVADRPADTALGIRIVKSAGLIPAACGPAEVRCGRTVSETDAPVRFDFLLGMTQEKSSGAACSQESFESPPAGFLLRQGTALFIAAALAGLETGAVCGGAKRL